MARRKKTDWLDDAIGHVVKEAARGIGKRLRTALETPRASAGAVVPQNPKPQTQNPVVNVFQGPTQVNVQRRQKQTAHRKPRTANHKAIDVEFEVKDE